MRSYFLLAVVCTSLGAGNASEAGKCAPGDASCRGLGDEEVLLQSVMIHEVDEEQKNLLGEEEDAEDDEEEEEIEEDEDTQAPVAPDCSIYITANSCPQTAGCQWFDDKCMQICSAFATAARCPERCTWDLASSSCRHPKAGPIVYSKKTNVGATKITAGASKVLKKIGGPGADLIFSLPLVISNLTNYSTSISLSQDTVSKNGGLKAAAYKFGNPESDKALLLENVAGFMATLLADPSAKAAGVAEKCPKGDSTVVKTCVDLGLCLVQTHLSSSPQAQMQFKSIYTMLEQLDAQFADIAWPMIKASLLHEEKVFLEGYAGEMPPPTHETSFLEASAYACPGKTALTEEDDSEDTAVRAAAYHTSAVLQATAKAAHAILDAHTHNSSQESTVQALQQAWKPSCELLNCDYTNYYDLFGVSHTHSLVLLEAGASLQHIRTHVRTRHRLEVRVQQFVGDHPDMMDLVMRRDTKTATRVQHFAGALKRHMLSFVSDHVATKTDAELMMHIGSQKLKEFHEDQSEENGASFQNAVADFAQLDEMQQQQEDGEKEDQELSQLEEESEEEDEEEEDHRGGKGRRPRPRPRRRARSRGRRGGFGKTMRRIGKGIAKAAKAVWKFIATNFKCLGQAAIMSTVGYNKKFMSEWNTWGGGLQFGVQVGFSTDLGNFLKTGFVQTLVFFVGIVIGGIPYDNNWGGGRAGVGVSGTIAISKNGVTAGISVATCAANVAPKTPAPPECVCGISLFNQFKCMQAFGAAITIMCCKYNFVTGKNTCR